MDLVETDNAWTCRAKLEDYLRIQGIPDEKIEPAIQKWVGSAKYHRSWKAEDYTRRWGELIGGIIWTDVQRFQLLYDPEFEAQTQRKVRLDVS